MKRAALAIECIELLCLRSHALRIEVGECIQLRFETLDLPDVRFGQLHDGELAVAQEFKLPQCRQ
jgi:hypothetical protein